MTELPLPEESIFAQALEITSATERAAFLNRACRGNQALRAEVEALLRTHDRAGDLLDLPENEPFTTELPTRECRGTVVGPYKLLEPIGEGGMGTVWMAEQSDPIERRVAVKVVKEGMDSRQVLSRFEAERQALALMEHPNIAKVLDAGKTPSGRPYFVMELVKGQPITDYCDEKRLGVRERLALFGDVCRAVQHAHQKGIIHRDIKPSNVLVAPYDGKPVVKVIDFGVAKATGRRLTDKTLFTSFGALVGTPEYMSPEQAEVNNQDVDTRSDIYSLGVLLYELLTGSTPLTRKRIKEAALLEVLRVIREEEPPRPSTRLSESKDFLPSISAQRQTEPAKLTKLVRGELDWIVMKSLEKDRNRRYETANALAMDVERYLTYEPVLACPPSAWYRLRKLARRNRAVLATASVVAASLVAVAVLSVLYGERQRRFAIDKAEATRNITALAGDLKTSLAGSNRLLAMRNFDRGQAAFEQEQIGAGLLWMIESWRSAVAAGDQAWQHAARANLAAWQPHHPRLKAVLSHAGPVDSAAFSPDGKLIVTGSDDRTAQLWDAATGQPVGQPMHHQGTVLAVAFSPDGKSVLTGCSDKTARLWDTATGQPLGSPFHHGGEVAAVAYAPDGRAFLTGSTDNRAQRWEVSTCRHIGEPLLHRNRLASVAFSADGKSFLTGSGDRTARLWDAASGKPIGSPFNHSGPIWSVAYSPDGTALLTGGSDGVAQQWNAATGKPLGEPIRHRLKVRAVAFSTDGRNVLTGSEDKTARLWDAATNQPVGPILMHQGPVVAVAFSPDRKAFLTASSDNTVRLWDADARQPFGLILDRQDVGQTVAFSPDGKSIFSGHWGGSVMRWDTATGRRIGPTLHHQGPVVALAVSHDGTMLLTGSNDKTARLWYTATGKPIGPAIQHEDKVSVVAFCSDGKTIMTGGEDRMVRLWDAFTGAPLGQPVPQSGSVDAGAFSPDGKFFLAGSSDGSAQVWDVAKRTPLGQPFSHPGCISAAAFSPDGKTLLTGCEDGAARLWNVETGKLRIAPLRHQAWIWAAAFNPEGTIVLTGGRDKTARLWDAATGMPLGPPIPHPTQLHTVAFSPDGNCFLTGGYDHGDRLFRKVPELPDDLDRVATWVELLTGLRLDPENGTIHTLDNAAWRERRERLKRLGGPPEAGGGPRLDPFPIGFDLLARGRVLTQRGHWDQAETAFDEVVRARPYNASSWVRRAGFRMARGQPERAVADFSEAVELASNRASAWSSRADCYSDLGQYDKAVADYSKAVELEPTNAQLWHARGVCYCDRLGQPAKAVTDFSTAIELNPKYMNAWCNRGIAHFKLGQYDKAVADCSRAIELDPTHAHALNIRADCYRALGEPEKAVTDRSRAVELGPNDAWAHINLGQALKQNGQFREALGELRRGHEIGSRGPRWAQPSAQWVRQCERLIELDEKLQGTLENKTTLSSADERIELAGLCSLKRRHRAAVRFYEDAFSAKLALAIDLGASHRYNAACAAALAGCGQGNDADKLDAKERSRLRRQALDWLRADLDDWRRVLDEKPEKISPAITNQMRHSLEDIDFAGVRGQQALAKLPEEERKPWQELWDDVANTLARAQINTTPQKMPAVK
jgi:eukaryotic-like serine/threonine-protein kinase